MFNTGENVKNNIRNILIINNLCYGCGGCVSVCSPLALVISNGTAQIDQDKCILCLSCIEVCPVSAIKEVESDEN